MKAGRNARARNLMRNQRKHPRRSSDRFVEALKAKVDGFKAMKAAMKAMKKPEDKNETAAMKAVMKAMKKPAGKDQTKALKAMKAFIV